MANYMTKSEAGVIREKKQVVVDRELDRLYKRHKTLTTDLLIDAARDENHALHKYFEWDNDKAADKYRRAQAYAMIQASKFVFVLEMAKDDGPPKIAHAAQQAQVRRLLPTFRGEGFKMRNEVLDESDTRAAFVERKKEALRAWCRSVVDVKELDALRKMITDEIGEKA